MKKWEDNIKLHLGEAGCVDEMWRELFRIVCNGGLCFSDVEYSGYANIVSVTLKLSTVNRIMILCLTLSHKLIWDRMGRRRI
jgi:hypothetical protein